MAPEYHGPQKAQRLLQQAPEPVLPGFPVTPALERPADLAEPVPGPGRAVSGRAVAPATVPVDALALGLGLGCGLVFGAHKRSKTAKTAFFLQSNFAQMPANQPSSFHMICIVLRYWTKPSTAPAYRISVFASFCRSSSEGVDAFASAAYEGSGRAGTVESGTSITCASIQCRGGLGWLRP